MMNEILELLVEQSVQPKEFDDRVKSIGIRMSKKSLQDEEWKIQYYIIIDDTQHIFKSDKFIELDDVRKIYVKK